MRVFTILTIAVLTLAVVVLGRAVVRLENYHYANSLGFCDKYDVHDPRQLLARDECLIKTRTRTHWFWHILYGIGAF